MILNAFRRVLNQLEPKLSHSCESLAYTAKRIFHLWRTLHHGLVNMSCEFSSLPEPASVTWLHKAPNSISWVDFACSTKDETKQCRETEHRVTSRCLLRTNSLTMTGAYRCQATTAEEKHKAISSEFAVNVVGIEKISILHYHLPYGKLGHIEVEVCANPKPEIFWLAPNAIIRPHTGQRRSLQVRKYRDGPASVVPYCYTSRLLIRNVTSADDFQLLVKGESDSRTIDLPVVVTGFSSIAAYPLHIAVVLIVAVANLL
ncbi:unnamed protein product [Heligmosomoides polygyrus]|uniref:Ig-like domain-containing protein n=1 Tax=Heligmosomoides polygyrus TaxID=6339 RepID=A0A3P8D1Z8_HELPZ|nr:unnamed protein product [Heligmosomoides polygyrus]